MTVRENVRSPLAPSVVDVVACWLIVARREVDALRGHLSPDECARADRFIAERARGRFVVARGRLRQMLGTLGGRPPREVLFAVAEGGKPRLADHGGRLRFNVAHSNDLMLCAVALDHEVGIDVEHVRQDFDYEGLARRFFAEDEVRALLRVPPALARDAFFACWTRKEAVIKATGEGMARPLDSFVVSVDPARGDAVGRSRAGPPRGVVAGARAASARVSGDPRRPRESLAPHVVVSRAVDSPLTWPGGL